MTPRRSWAFGTDADIHDRVALGLLEEIQAQHEQQYRAAQRDTLVTFLRSRGLLRDNSTDPAAVLTGWLSFLAPAKQNSY